MNKLELFYFESCPFCQRVLNHIETLKISVEMKDIQRSQDDLNRLVKDTGRRTVPCLYIDNKPMFESMDIMNWLTENQNNLKKKEA